MIPRGLGSKAARADKGGQGLIVRLFRPAAVFVSALAIAACEEKVVEQEVVRPVQAMKVGDPSELGRRTFPGRARAHKEVNLSFRVAGPLIARPVIVGDRVKAGELVARIDPQDFEVRLRTVEAQLERARSELEAMRIARPERIRAEQAAVEKADAALTLANQELTRVQRIQQQDPGAVSQNLVDQKVAEQRRADSQLRQAREALQIAEVGARPEDISAKEAEIRSLEASVQNAKDELSYTFLRAPFDGGIVATFVENFEDVRAKQPILRILDSSKVEMVINIPETLISYAPYVKDVRVRFDAFPDRSVPAEIYEIGTEASQTTRTYPVTLIMDQPEDIEILPGMAGQSLGDVSDVPVAGVFQQGIMVPVAAVFSPDDSGKSYVWVIDESTMTVSRREVATGPLGDVGIGITDGLEVGEWIATAGANTLREGQKINILERAGS